MTRRSKTKKTVTRRKRIYRTITVTKTMLQCERPYILFGAVVSERRRKLGLTQQDLADRVGLSRGSIANIETGRQRILLTDVFDFADALDTNVRKLFEATTR